MTEEEASKFFDDLRKKLQIFHKKFTPTMKAKKIMDEEFKKLLDNSK